MLQQLNMPASAAKLTDGFIAKSARLETLVPADHPLGAPAVLFQIISKEQEVSLFNRWVTGYYQYCAVHTDVESVDSPGMILIFRTSFWPVPGDSE